MPMRREKYPQEWEKISLRVRELAKWRCEWCGVENGAQLIGVKGRPYKVVLTVAHTDLDGGDKHDKHNLNGLRALCQKCHLRYDHADHMANARRTRQAKKALVQPSLELGI